MPDTRKMLKGLGGDLSTWHVLWRAAASAALLTLAGCASIPEAYKFKNQPPHAAMHGRALLIIYRQNQFKAAGADVQLLADGHALGALSNGTYLYADMSPGSYTLMAAVAGAEAVPLVASYEADTIYYLKVDFTMAGLLSAPKTALMLIPSSQAQGDLENLGLATGPQIH